MLISKHSFILSTTTWFSWWLKQFAAPYFFIQSPVSLACNVLTGSAAAFDSDCSPGPCKPCWMPISCCCHATGQSENVVNLPRVHIVCKKWPALGSDSTLFHKECDGVSALCAAALADVAWWSVSCRLCQLHTHTHCYSRRLRSKASKLVTRIKSTSVRAILCSPLHLWANSSKSFSDPIIVCMLAPEWLFKCYYK